MNRKSTIAALAGSAVLAIDEVNGRQFVVIAAGGGKNTEAATAAKIVAYATSSRPPSPRARP